MKYLYTSFFIAICLILFYCGESKIASESSKSEESQAGGDALFVDADAGKTWNIFGLQIVGKIMSAETDGRYSVVRSTTPPQGGPPTHVHENEDELFYVVQGDYQFRCGDETVRVTTGGLAYLPRKLPHGFRNTGEQPGILLNTITPGGFERFFDEIDRLPKDKPLDRAKVTEIAAAYGLTFLPESNP